MKGKEFPEAELVKRTYIIREMDLPPQIKLTKRSMLRWFALAFGLISEKESRSTLLDVLDALFHYNFSKKMAPTSEQVIQYVSEHSGKKAYNKLVLYHLKRLTGIGFIIRKNGKYEFNQSPYADKYDAKAAFSHRIIAPIDAALGDISDLLEKLAESYKK